MVTTFAPLRSASPSHLMSHRSQRRCAADPGPTTYLLAVSRRSILQNPALTCGERLFRFKKNLSFSSKTVFLGVDLGTHLFIFFYHKKCSQPNPPILVSFSQQQKKKKKHKKTSFFEPSN
jgi:hypothetical protein